MNREQKELEAKLDRWQEQYEFDFIDSVWLDNAKEYLEELGIPTHEAEEMADWALANDIEDLDDLPEEYLKAKKETQEERERKDKWEDWSEEQSDLFVDMFGEGSSDGIKDFYKNIGEMFNKVD